MPRPGADREPVPSPAPRTGDGTRQYCVYFDKRFLVAGLTLYRSLQAVSGGPLRLWVLSLDAETHEALQRLNWPGVISIPLTALEQSVPELLVAKSERSMLEYYYTCTAAWIGFVLERIAPGETIVYLDADLFFFCDPGDPARMLGDDSILLTEHLGPEGGRIVELHGRFNVGFMIFRNDESAARRPGISAPRIDRVPRD